MSKPIRSNALPPLPRRKGSSPGKGGSESKDAARTDAPKQRKRRRRKRKSKRQEARHPASSGSDHGAAALEKARRSQSKDNQLPLSSEHAGVAQPAGTARQRTQALSSEKPGPSTSPPPKLNLEDLGEPLAPDEARSRAARRKRPRRPSAPPSQASATVPQGAYQLGGQDWHGKVREHLRSLHPALREHYEQDVEAMLQALALVKPAEPVELGQSHNTRVFRQALHRALMVALAMSFPAASERRSVSVRALRLSPERQQALVSDLQGLEVLHAIRDAVVANLLRFTTLLPYPRTQDDIAHERFKMALVALSELSPDHLGELAAIAEAYTRVTTLSAATMVDTHADAAALENAMWARLEETVKMCGEVERLAQRAVGLECSHGAAVAARLLRLRSRLDEELTFQLEFMGEVSGVHAKDRGMQVVAQYRASSYHGKIWADVSFIRAGGLRAIDGATVAYRPELDVAIETDLRHARGQAWAAFCQADVV